MQDSIPRHCPFHSIWPLLLPSASDGFGGGGAVPRKTAIVVDVLLHQESLEDWTHSTCFLNGCLPHRPDQSIFPPKHVDSTIPFAEDVNAAAYELHLRSLETG